MLKEMLFALMVSHAPGGKSIYSHEPVVACGPDKGAPLCELKPSCTKPSVLCRKPRWSAFRSAWVIPERKPTAHARYRVIATALAKVSQRVVLCLGADSGLLEDCKPARGWPRGTDQDASLAIATLVAAMQESGLREDIQIGAPPLGIGPGGEVSLIQAMPEYVPEYADWIDDEERKRVVALPFKEKLAWVKGEVLGTDELAVSKALSVGARMLARRRSGCRGKGSAWHYMMYSAYGTGKTCTTSLEFAYRRSRIYQSFWAKRREYAKMGKELWKKGS